MIENKENFPKDPDVYLKYYSFKDKEKVYTNGVELIPLSRALAAIHHYIEKTKKHYKKKNTKFYYIEELDRYLIGKYKDNTNLYFAEVTKEGELIYRYRKEESWGNSHFPKQPEEILFGDWLVGWAKQNYE